MTDPVCMCPADMVDIRCRVHGAGAVYVPPVALFDTVEAGPYVLRLPFTTPPLTVNEARKGAGWGGLASSKKVVQQAVVAVIKQARVPALERVAVTLTWYAPDYGTRDPDSLAFMVKACCDACTPARPAVARGSLTAAGTPRKKAQAAKLGAGIIPDDHAGYVESVTMRIVLGSPDPHLELRLDPLPALPVRTTPTARGAGVLRRTPRRR